jgi:Mis12 protein
MDVNQNETTNNTAIAMEQTQSAASSSNEHDAPPKFEREEKFFNRNPISVVDDIINCTQDYVCDGLDVLEKTLVREIGAETASDVQKTAIGESVDYMYKKIDNVLSSNLDLFELYVFRNIMRIPEDVPVDNATETAAEQPAHADVDVPALDQEIISLRSQVRALQLANAKMSRQAAQLDAEFDAVSKVQHNRDAILPDSVFEPLSEIKEIVKNSKMLQVQNDHTMSKLVSSTLASPMTLDSSSSAPSSGKKTVNSMFLSDQAMVASGGDDLVRFVKTFR